jgi:CRP-like cAMP-binding protein
VHEGELTSAFSFVYFVTLGQVAVYKTTAAEKILHTMGIGDYFGEMAYLDVGSRRTSSCCALTNW